VSRADESITLCRNGPLIVRGDVVVLDEDGDEVAGHRATVALCRCGKSRTQPFCDGTHKAVKFAASGRGRRQVGQSAT
jgi:CDGSH-type Zn-finger protein